MRRFFFFIVLLLILAAAYMIIVIVPGEAVRQYGPPVRWLTFPQRIQYSASLLWYDGLLTVPLDPAGAAQTFFIEDGESVITVAYDLEERGFIRSADAFLTYLIYSGLDTSIQSGEYQLNPAMSALQIAHELQDATLDEVRFVILPGWRAEEIAASLSTSGLAIETDQFMAALNTSAGYDFLTGSSSLEGFLFPDSYILPRTASANDVLLEFVRRFSQNLTREVQLGFENQGLSTYQAVVIASIVERESVHYDEAPLIVSVYLNRVRAGIKLEADPTVQYGIGYNAVQSTWWTNPLSANDLAFDSPFNTYIYAGLPPGPIANPSLSVLQAVAFPAETDFYFFRAKCDGSGYHAFAVTFEEHVANGC